MKKFFSHLFDDNNSINEKSVVGFIAFLMLVIRPTVMRMLGLLKTPEELQAEQEAIAAPLMLADGELTPEDMNSIQLGEGETLEEIKAKLKHCSNMFLLSIVNILRFS
mgnify:CR=1 FL=1